MLFFGTLQTVEILRMDYEPSDLDILYAEGVTSSNGLACVDFSFPQSSPNENIDTAGQHDSLLRWVPILSAHFSHVFSKCSYLHFVRL